MGFIDSIEPANAQGQVAAMYRRLQGTDGRPANYALAFSHRPAVMEAWSGLQRCLQANMDHRRYTLVSLVAAHAMGNSYCSLAWGLRLAEQVGAHNLPAILAGGEASPLDEIERAVVALAGKVARDPAAVTAGDIAALRWAGCSEPEIFDVVAAAAGRCFFARIPDALGFGPDRALAAAAGDMAALLTVGRPADGYAPADGSPADGSPADGNPTDGSAPLTGVGQGPAGEKP